MQSFVELLKDHALILASANALRDITDRSEPAPAAAARALQRLSRLLTAHLRAEAEFIQFDNASMHPEFAALAASHDLRFDRLVAEAVAYLQAWDEEMIAQDWTRFGQDSRAIFARLGEQLDLENSALYPAALRYGLIRLMPETRPAAAEPQPA